MAIFRSERVSALLLIAAAALGLILANTPIGADIIHFSHLKAGLPVFSLSLAHWVTDGLLAIFFFLAALELRHEFSAGELRTARTAIVPAAAAVGGVAIPAVIYLLVAHSPELAIGWPIPTATDIAFALGVLSLVGRGLPSRVRVLLLALAVIDDLIAIILIAVFFTTSLALVPLLIAVPVVAAFGWLSYRKSSVLVTVGLIVLGVAAWVLVALSGIHPTIAGVALGLIMAGRPGGRVRHALEPWSNGIVLPLFAFVAALVAIPHVSLGELSPMVWAIIVALPVGKLIGITGGAILAIRLSGAKGDARPPVGDLLVVASLGGIGFTVSLLMNDLAWRGSPDLAAEGTIAVITASVLAALIGVILTTLRARHHRTLA